MKAVSFTSTLIAALFIIGCEYEAPLSAEHTIPVDPELPGLWKAVQESESSEGEVNMMVLQYSKTEYLIHYPYHVEGIYYRGYPVQIGGVSCVQLEAIGTQEGPVESDEKILFHVASYTITNGVLEIRMLNTDVVDDDLKTTEELKKAFLENIKHPELFEDEPVRFSNRKREA